MVTTVELVEKHLENDLVLSEALARGVLNIRRAARQLIDEREWDVTEEAVVSALRRYDPGPNVDLANVFLLLSETRKTGETGLAMITVPRVREYVSKMAQIAKAIGSDDKLGFIPDDKQLMVLVDDSNASTVLDILPPDKEYEQHRDVGKVELRFPEVNPLNGAAVGVVLHHFGLRGIRILSVCCNFPACSIYVKDREFADAYELARELQTRFPKRSKA